MARRAGEQSEDEKDEKGEEDEGEKGETGEEIREERTNRARKDERRTKRTRARSPRRVSRSSSGGSDTPQGALLAQLRALLGPELVNHVHQPADIGHIHVRLEILAERAHLGSARGRPSPHAFRPPKEHHLGAHAACRPKMGSMRHGRTHTPLPPHNHPTHTPTATPPLPIHPQRPTPTNPTHPIPPRHPIPNGPPPLPPLPPPPTPPAPPPPLYPTPPPHPHPHTPHSSRLPMRGPASKRSADEPSGRGRATPTDATPARPTPTRAHQRSECGRRPYPANQSPNTAGSGWKRNTGEAMGRYTATSRRQTRLLCWARPGWGPKIHNSTRTSSTRRLATC